MVIDVLDPKQGGILWYYTGRAMRAVNPESIKDLTDNEEKIAAIQKQIEASRTYDMIEILNKEIEARRILARNGYNINPFSTGVWLMGYYANDPNANSSTLLEFASAEARKAKSGITKDYIRPDEYKFYKDITPILQAMGINSASFDYSRQVLDTIWPEWKNWISQDGYYLDQNKYNAMLEELKYASRLLATDEGKKAFAEYLGFATVEELNEYLNRDLNGVKELVFLAREIKERVDKGIAEWEDEHYLPRKIRDAREEYQRIASSGRGLSQETILSMMKPDLAEAYRAYEQIVDDVVSEVQAELTIMAQLRKGKDTGSGVLEPISRNLLRNYSYIVRKNGATSEEIARVRSIIRENEFQTAEPVLRQVGTVISPQPQPEPQPPAPQPPQPAPQPQPPAQLTPVEQQLSQFWQLSGDQLAQTAEYFEEVKDKIDRELRRVIRSRRQREEFADAVIEKLIQGIDEWTEDVFSFWMQKAPDVYTGWRTGYPESDGTYSEFIQMFVSRFINRLEDKVRRKGPERINLDEIFEYAKRGGWYINRGTRDARYVTFEEAMQDIKDKIAEAEQATAPPVPESPAEPEQPQQTTEPPVDITLPPGIEFAPGEEAVPETAVTPPAPVEGSPAEGVSPQESAVEPPAPETTHPLPAEAPEVVAGLTAGEETTQTGTVTPPAEAPVEAPAPEEPAPQQVTVQSIPPAQPEFRFNGWITGPVNAEVGKPVQFVMNGNILQLENPKLIIMDKDGNTVAELDVTSSTISYTFTSAGRYTAQVVGTKGDETYYTNRFTVNVTSPPQPPQAPQNLNITIEDRNATLTWQDTADKYIIELYRDGRRYSSPVTISNNRFSYNWLQPGDYEVRVYAVSEENLVSPDYASQNFTIERPFTFNGSLSGGTSVKVNTPVTLRFWGNIDELDSASLIITDQQGNEVVNTSVSGVNSYTFTPHNPGTYTAQIKGTKNGKDYSTNSVTIRVTQPPQPPAIPTDLIATINGKNAVFSWQGEAPFYRVSLYRDGERVKSTTTSNNTLTFYGLDYGNYEVRVSAFNNQGLMSQGYASTTFTIERPFRFRGSLSGGGIKEVGQTTRFGVWGNVDELDNAQLIIQDTNGQQVAQIAISEAGWYEYTWENPGTYTAQVIGTKDGEHYSTNSVTVRVEPAQPPAVTAQTVSTSSPEVPQLPVVNVYSRAYDLEEWLNPNIKWFKWNKVESADGYLWQLFKVKADGTETPVYTNPDSERIVTRNKLRLDTSELEPGTYIFKVKAIKIDVSGNIINQSPEFGEGRQFTIEARESSEVIPPVNPGEQSSAVEPAVQTQEVAASTPVDTQLEMPATTRTTFASRKLPAEAPDVTATLTPDSEEHTTAALNSGEQIEVIPEVEEPDSIVTTPSIPPAPEINIQDAEYNASLNAYVVTDDVVAFQFSGNSSRYSARVYQDKNNNGNYEESELVASRNNYPQNTFWFMPTVEGRYKIIVQAYGEDGNLSEPASLEFVYQKQQTVIAQRDPARSITATTTPRSPRPSRLAPSRRPRRSTILKTSSHTTIHHTSPVRRRFKTAGTVKSATPRRTAAGYASSLSLIPASFNSGDLLPSVNTSPVLSSLLPDLNFLSVRKPTLTELSLPGYSFPVYVDTVSYWTGIGNKFTHITGNLRIADIAIPGITYSFYKTTGFLPYQVRTDRRWSSPLYTSGFSDTITGWTNTIVRDFSRNYSIYTPWEDTLLNSINWANRLYDVRLGLLL